MSMQQLQARALGDPTRHTIFRYLADQRRPVDVAELTDYIGLHHNAIRQHLARLVAAGLVVESTAAPTGRGRPRLVYEVRPSVDSRWGVPGPYEQLSVLLSEIIRTGDTPVDVGRRAGSTLEIVAVGSDPAAAMADRLDRYGFDPVTKRSGNHVDFVLRACPFETTALADPDIVCGLHLGLAHGLADSISRIVVDELVRADPRQSPCVLRCHIEPNAD